MRERKKGENQIFSKLILSQLDHFLFQNPTPEVFFIFTPVLLPTKYLTTAICPFADAAISGSF